MSRQAKPYVSPEEYLALERQAETKHEYVDGEMFAWAGASRKHNLIEGNILTSLNSQLRGKPCEVYPGEMRVKSPASRAYVYPDVVVVYDEPQFEDDYVDTLLNPTVVFEVLSKSTEPYNRLAKSAYYRTIESLSEYVLVAQEEYRVEQYVKQLAGRWLLTEVRSLETVIELDSISCSLALRDIYDRISFD
ncbi:MAG TPA: Uma2 family endonuclease [Pyrinomonadaceae bacterium]|nr:Uma2 family endonuclease [Pyrinomonadaceae bacterium]